MTLPTVIAALTVLLMLGVGGSTATVGPWYRDLRKPSWNPPNRVFAPVWTLILGLAAWSGAVSSNEHVRILVLFGINIVLYLLWTPLFFNLRRPDWALIEIPFLWLSIVSLILGLAPLSPTSSWLLAPYLLWVTFAAFLNLTIVRLNGASSPGGS